VPKQNPLSIMKEKTNQKRNKKQTKNKQKTKEQKKMESIHL
jgi:hypothetical protein